MAAADANELCLFPDTSGLPYPTNSGNFTQFGKSIDVDGDTVIIGTGTGSQCATIYLVDPDNVVLKATLTPNGATANSWFGWSVGVSGDTALVGAWRDATNGADAGAAFVFVREASGQWTQQAKLLASDGAPDQWFGRDVAIQGDTAVVGAMSSESQGSVYVFERNAGDQWIQQAKLVSYGFQLILRRGPARWRSRL